MPRVRAFDEHYDTTMVFKAAISIPTMLGIGLLVGSLLPQRAGVAISCVALGRALALKWFKPKSSNSSMQVLPGRKTVKIQGDFVVFHIGARPNQGIDSYFGWQGQARDAMMRELEAAGTSLGYLGGEYFEGSATQGPLSIQYWRSMEDLNRFARSRTNQHAGPWANLMKKGRETSAYGFYHESFLVKEGNYECIYVNCPAMLLGNCHETELVAATGKNVTAAGRAGRKDFVEYPEDLGKPDY